jgi:nucleoside-diphosphate-sugar epimerase
VNLAYGQSTTVLDLYTKLCEFAQARLGAREIPAPIMAPPRKGDVRHSLAATEAAKARFGFVPKVGFAEGLQRTFEWYRATAAPAAR